MDHMDQLTANDCWAHQCHHIEGACSIIESHGPLPPRRLVVVCALDDHQNDRHDQCPLHQPRG